MSHDRPTSGLDRIVTAGEPVEAELRAWMAERFGITGTEVVDGWGQVLLGGIVYLRHASQHMPDCGLKIMSDDGVRAGEAGEMVLTTPLPGRVRQWQGPGSASILKRQQRFGTDFYATGDRVTYSDSGEVIHHGRLDDLVSISGQLISLSAVENVIDDHPYVKKSTAVVIRSQVLGRAIIAIVARADTEELGVDDDAIALEIMTSVHDVLGGLARPKTVAFTATEALAATRSELAEEVSAHLHREEPWFRLRP